MISSRADGIAYRMLGERVHMAEFLASPSSTYVLSDDKIGWLSDHGTQDLALTPNVGRTSYAFEDFFSHCDPS